MNMIPIHNRKDRLKMDIAVHRLGHLSAYDSTLAHRHNYFEFFVFEKGGGIHFIDFEEIPILSNSIHIVAPGQVHQVARDLTSSGYVFLFELDHFSNELLLEDFLFNHICMDVHEVKPNYVFPLKFKNQIVPVAKKSWIEYNSNEAYNFQLVKNQLAELVLYCLRTSNFNRQMDIGQHGLYIEFRKKLKEQFKHLKKVKEYANLLAVSEKNLNEIVQQRTGETASSIIYKQLILESKRLLNAGQTSKEIAYELNFSDPSHFSKFFKSQTNQSPSEFRIVHAKV